MRHFEPQQILLSPYLVRSFRHLPPHRIFYFLNIIRTHIFSANANGWCDL